MCARWCTHARASGAEPLSRLPAGCAYQVARHADRHPADRRPRVSRAQDARKKRYRVNLPLARPCGVRALQSADDCGPAHTRTHAHTNCRGAAALYCPAPLRLTLHGISWVAGESSTCCAKERSSSTGPHAAQGPQRRPPLPGPETRDAQRRRRAQRASLCLDESFGACMHHAAQMYNRDRSA